MCAQQGRRSLSSLRVLMQMRSNALTQRGGDTVVMEKLVEGMRAHGHVVDVDLEMKANLRDYDIVHLYNFATADITREQAQKAVDAGVPFVVTTMYEDWPLFFNKMVDSTVAVAQYIEAGQPREKWNDLQALIGRSDPAGPQDNTFTAAHAQALIPTGVAEKKALLRDYPKTKRVEIYHCGCDYAPSGDRGELFRSEYGVKDFVLCVGRLETRKNQLMLLKAMEESDLTLVLAGGGFTYQPEYENLCRKFNRRGKTLILGKLERSMLASAFAAAKVHVLPSWFELPGLVNIEAAHYGTNIVVSDYGTVQDYVGDDAFYCRPDQAESIMNAITAAYYAPPRPNLAERVREFTWANAVTRNLEIYGMVLSEFGYVKESVGAAAAQPEQPQLVPPAANAPSDFSRFSRLSAALRGIEKAATGVSHAGETVSAIPKKLVENFTDPRSRARADELCEEGDRLAKSGQNAEAAARYEEAEKVCGAFSRPARSLGVLELTQQRSSAAEEHFKRAVLLDDGDVRARTGLGVCRWNSGAKEEGFTLLRESLKRAPGDMPSLLYFMGQCYELSRFVELEEVLRNFLAQDSSNAEMHYSYAGSLYKLKRYDDAEQALKRGLERNANLEGAKELQALIDKERSELPKPAPVEPPKHREIEALEALHKQKKYEEVIARGEAMLERNDLQLKDRLLLAIVLGEAYACTANFPKATEAFHSAEECGRLVYRAISGQGVVAAAQQQWDEAEGHFKRAVQANESYDVSHAGLGLCAKQRGDREAAWDAYSQAAQLNPENHRAVLALIELAYPMRRLAELETVLLRSLEFCPANLSLLYAYAGCAYAQGKIDLAVEQLTKIRLFDPAHELANELMQKIEEDRRMPSRALA